MPALESEDAVPGTGPSTPDPPRARYSLTINSAGVFVAAVLVQLIGFIGSLFVYKYVGVSANGQALYGTIQLFFLIASTINTLGDLRLGGGYQLFLARGRPATSNTGTYLVLRFLMIGLCCGMVLAFSGVSISGLVLAPTLYEFEVIGIFMVIPLLWTLETVYSNYYIGIGNSVKGQYPNLVEVIARAPALIVVTFIDPTMMGLALAYLIGAVVGGAFSVPALIPLVRRYRSGEAKLLFTYSWPLLGALGLSTLQGTLIPFVVAATLGTQQLNLFNSANALRTLALALPTAITTPLFPYLASLHKRTEYDAIREATWTAMRYSSILLIPGVVALAVYRVNVLSILYNPLYAHAQWALVILVVSAIPASLATLMGTGLAAIGWRRLELYLTALQTGMLFGIAILLLPPYGLLPASDGLISASIAVLASGVAAWALNAYFTYRLMAVSIFPRSFAAIAAAAVVAFVAISRINTVLPINRYYQLAFGVVVGFLVYFIVLALIGELTKEDIHRIGRSMAFPLSWLDVAARFCWRPKSPHIIAPVDVREVPGLTSGYVPEDERGKGRSADPKLPPRRRGGTP